MQDQAAWRLELKQQQIAMAHDAQAGVDVVEGELPVRPGRHDDRVFSAAIYRDERPPCQHTRDQAYMSRVDVVFGERTLKQRAVRVVADGSDDCRCRACPCRRDRLVRALSSRRDDNLGTEHGLAGRRHPGHVYSVVGIQTADHEYLSGATDVVHSGVP